jgi:hypothetical protein
LSTVDIPDQAWDVAWRTFSESLAEADSHLDYVEALADAITAAAPLIAATELRRIVDLFVSESRTPMDLRQLVTYVVSLLQRRADELDPPGGAS